MVLGFSLYLRRKRPVFKQMVVTEYFDGDQATGDLAPSTQVQQPSIPVLCKRLYANATELG